MSHRVKKLDLYDGKPHVVETPFICEFCSKKFQFRAQLAIHLRTHTGEKPYKCPECSKSFSQRQHVTAHMKSAHIGERPFSCDICGKSFVLSFSLTNHKKTHLKDKAFVCVVCS